MSRYSARLRQLEAKLRPGECRVCAGGRWEIVTVEGDEAPPPAPLCEACGQPAKRFIVWFMDNDADEGTLRPLPVAEREEAPVDNNTRAERAKPRVRRRQYSGQG